MPGDRKPTRGNSVRVPPAYKRVVKSVCLAVFANRNLVEDQP